MRIIVLALIMLTGVTACGHIKDHVCDDCPVPTSPTYFACNVGELDRKYSYYKKEYTRLWNVLNREYYSERLDVDPSYEREVQNWENLMRQFEYDIDYRYRRVLNNCRAQAECVEVNGDFSPRCGTTEQELVVAKRDFDRLDDTLGAAGTRLDSLIYRIKRPVIPQQIPRPTIPAPKDGADASNSGSKVNQNERCTTVGTVFTECKD